MQENYKHKNIWNEEYLPKIQAINNKYCDHFYNTNKFKNELYVEYNEYNSSVVNFKYKHNDAAYWALAILGLPLSFICLIFPFYWALKKFKELKKNKHKLLNEIKKEQSDLSNIKQKYINEIDLNNYFSEILSVLKYKEMGPIYTNFVTQLANYKNIKFSPASNQCNPYTTSWGIFDNKHIVLNFAVATRVIKDYEYIGTVQRSYRSGDNWRIEIINATYTHPMPVFEKVYNTFFYFEHCLNLSFSFVKKYPGLIKKSTRKNQTALENINFEKLYDWNRDDETQFRMFFTPYTQEIYIEEDYDNHNDKEIDPKLNFSKFGPLVSSNYKTYNDFGFDIHGLLKLYNDYISNNSMEINDFYNEIKTFMTSQAHDMFNKLYPGIFFPIIKSTNHKTIIDSIVNHPIEQKNINIGTQYYILYKIINPNFTKMDTDSFEICTDTLVFDYNSQTSYYTIFDSITYMIEKKVIYINKYGVHTGFASVPVHYDDYIEFKSTCHFLYVFLEDKNLIFSPYKVNTEVNNINQNAINEIIKLSVQYDVSFHIKYGFLCIYDNNFKYSKAFLHELIYIIKELL